MITTAKKEHDCKVCGRIIKTGERYERDGSVFDSDGRFNPVSFISCRHCARIAIKISKKEDRAIAFTQSRCPHYWQISESYTHLYCTKCGKTKKYIFQPSKKQWADLSRVVSLVVLK